MSRQKRDSWHLKRETYPKAINGVTPMSNGTPRLVSLLLEGTDEAFRGNEYVECCDCGLQHLTTYEVFFEKQRLHMHIRAYRGKANG